MSDPADEQSVMTGRQQRVDVAVALVLAAAGVLSLVVVRDAGVPQPSWAPTTPEQVAWVVALALPLALRRRWPVTVLVVVGALFIAQQARGVFEPYVTSITLYLALYTVGARCADRRLATVARAVVVVAMFSWLGISLSLTAWSEVTAPSEAPEGSSPVGLLPPRTAAVLLSIAYNAVYFAAVWVFGNLAWRARRQQDELAATNEALRRSRDENARRAVLAERVRIARELHDVVASHVSVMGVQAGAARRVMDTDAGAARSALRSVEDAGRTAVAEMHQLVGVLRDDDAGPDGPPRDGRSSDGGSSDVGAPTPEPPAPVLGAIPALVERVRATGAAADYEEVGKPGPVPAAVGVSAYRVVQEALTTVVRHAGARTVSVRLRHLPGAVEVEVVDDGRGAAPSIPDAGERGDPPAARGAGGVGLVGMAERVALHDGLLDAGPRPQGGFRVRARFPVRDAVDER